jgi:GNAT superfamily N-acetyltransferase
MCAVHSGAMGASIRAGTLADVRALVRMHAECSPTSIEQRYLAPMPMLGAQLATCLLCPADGFSLVGEAEQEMVAIATVATSDDDPTTAEVGQLVVDRCQRQGIGTAMLLAATRKATRRGYERLELTVQPSNRSVLTMVGATGLRARVTNRDGFTHVLIPLPAGAQPPAIRTAAARSDAARLHSTDASANN